MDSHSPIRIERIVYSSLFERVIKKCKKKDSNLFERLTHEMESIIKDPTTGKPLRYALKNRRRIHVGSFVLIYEFHNNELRFIDFDHHDRIYKK